MSKKMARMGSQRHRLDGPVEHIDQKKSNGREIWHVKVAGVSRKRVTSETSINIMDDAVRDFAPTLKRLANR